MQEYGPDCLSVRNVKTLTFFFAGENVQTPRDCRHSMRPLRAIATSDGSMETWTIGRNLPSCLAPSGLAAMEAQIIGMF